IRKLSFHLRLRLPCPWPSPTRCRQGAHDVAPWAGREFKTPYSTQEQRLSLRPLWLRLGRAGNDAASFSGGSDGTNLAAGVLPDCRLSTRARNQEITGSVQIEAGEGGTDVSASPTRSSYQLSSRSSIICRSSELGRPDVAR